VSKLNPLDYPICFAHPLRITHSTWITHVPFAMFLVDVLHPTTLVELGTNWGVSYCAFCQAIKSLNVDCRSYAVDTWRGDPHSGPFGDEVLNDLRKHHDPLYGGFSRLVQSTFDDALPHFPDKSIDLLHIDGYHTYEAVKNDFDNWLPKVSNRGIILFHDVNVRERDFGVWKLWQELKSIYPNFEFAHGHGLGMIAVGTEYNHALDMFFNESEELRCIKDFFYQLGVNVENKYTINMQKAQLQSLAAQLAEKEEKLAGKEDEVNTYQQQLQNIRNSRL